MTRRPACVVSVAIRSPLVCYLRLRPRLCGMCCSRQAERRNTAMVDIVPSRALESRIKRILFVEPQSGYSTGFNDTVRVETLGPEYLAGAVADVAECELADLRVPGADLVEHMNRFNP